MTQAQLIQAIDERRTHKRYGRRVSDFLVDVDSALKLTTKIVAALMGLLMAAIGAGMTIEVALQEWRLQHSKFATPPAFEHKQGEKK